MRTVPNFVSGTNNLTTSPATQGAENTLRRKTQNEEPKEYSPRQTPLLAARHQNYLADWNWSLFHFFSAWLPCESTDDRLANWQIGNLGGTAVGCRSALLDRVPSTLQRCSIRSVRCGGMTRHVAPIALTKWLSGGPVN